MNFIGRFKRGGFLFSSFVEKCFSCLEFPRKPFAYMFNSQQRDLLCFHFAFSVCRFFLTTPLSREHDPNKEEFLNTSFVAMHTPKRVILKRERKRLYILFGDGFECKIPAELLRVYSPSADAEFSRTKDNLLKMPMKLSLNDITGGGSFQTKQFEFLKMASGRRHVGVMKMEPRGHYGVQLMFDDMHQSGIFTWHMLRDMGENFMRYARLYLENLKLRKKSRGRPFLRSKRI